MWCVSNLYNVMIVGSSFRLCKYLFIGRYVVNEDWNGWSRKIPSTSVSQITWLGNNYHPRLSDLEIARERPYAYKTHLSTLLASWINWYSAPEYVASGNLRLSNDIWSFGVVIYEKKSGQGLIKGNNTTLVGIIDPRLNGKYSVKAQILESNGNKLPKPAFKANTAEQILQWLRDTSKNIVENTDIGVRNGNSKYRSISANSMYRITETIQNYMQTINQVTQNQVTQKQLYAELLSMIADILAACLTNLPQVIAMKCHTSAIEKREANVHVAAQLLGETTQIINTIQDQSLRLLGRKTTTTLVGIIEPRLNGKYSVKAVVYLGTLGNRCLDKDHKKSL